MHGSNAGAETRGTASGITGRYRLNEKHSFHQIIPVVQTRLFQMGLAHLRGRQDLNKGYECHDPGFNLA